MAENTNSKNSDVLDQLNNKYFTELETLVPHIQQTLFDLQNEFYKSWKNAVTANTLLYKEFLNISGYDNKFPKTAKDILKSMGEEGLKYRSIWNKITISNIESVKNSAKIWNDNAEAFVDLNKKIMYYWLESFSPKRK